MINDLDDFYLQLEEPNRSCFLALRNIILSQDENITPEWKFKLPFFYYKGKMFCYIWHHKKFKQPYIAFMAGKRMEHPKLLLEKRATVKIVLIDPNKDLPIKTIKSILKQALAIHENNIASKQKAWN